jgi:hypothetical protein
VYTQPVAASQADLDRTIQAARDLLAGGSMISLGRLASKSGLGEAALKQLFDDAAARAAVERAAAARWVQAEGGIFLVR